MEWAETTMCDGVHSNSVVVVAVDDAAVRRWIERTDGQLLVPEGTVQGDNVRGREFGERNVLFIL